MLLKNLVPFGCFVFTVISSVTANKLMNLQQQKINDFKVQLQHNLEGARIRRKRQIGMFKSDPKGFTAEHLKIGNSYPDNFPYFSHNNFTTWTSFQHMNERFIFLGTTDGDLVVLDVTNNKHLPKIVAFSSHEAIALKTKAFTYYNDQWFIVHQSMGTFSKLQLYQRIGRGLEQRQAIVLLGNLDFDITNVRGKLYLVVVTRQVSNQGQVMLYHWTSTQFDFITSKPVQGAQSITCWSMDGVLFVSVAQFSDLNVILGSPVFLFSSDKGALVLQEKLLVKGPQKVAHFFVGGSHYLAFVGYENAEVFWWSSGQFLSWQTIQGTANALDVSILSLANGEVVLVITLYEEVLFLTLDSTGHYIITYNMKFSGFLLKSLQFLFDGASYYALALFADSSRVPPNLVYKLQFEKYELPNLTSIDPLVQCLGDLKEKVNERKNELDTLQQDLNRLWVTNKEQIITAEVYIKGEIASNLLYADEVKITSNVSVTTVPSNISTRIYTAQGTSAVINKELDNLVFKSKKQDITGALNFLYPVYVPTLSIPSLNYNLEVNDIPIIRLLSQTLRNHGDQTIPGNVQLNDVFANKITLRTLNNIQPDDIVLLFGKQNISGILSFQDVLSNNVEIGSLNSVQMSNVILKTKDETINEIKGIKFLNADSIAVNKQTNGEYLNKIQEKIFTLDNYQELSGHYEFQSALEIEDLFVNGLVNGIVEVSKFNTEAVNRKDPQKIAGAKVSSSIIHITEDVELKGHLNNINLDQLVTLSGDQTFTSNLSMKSINIHDHLLINTVNHLNLDEAVQRKSSKDTIEDIKSFSSLSAENIEMNDLVKINGIDISVEGDGIIKHKNGHIESEIAVFKDINVLGDLTVTNGLNGYKISDIPETLWLKSQNQKIESAVFIPSFNFHNIDLQVDKINDLDLKVNFIHINNDETIEDEKIFRENVVIKNTNIKAGKLLSGTDFHSLREENVDYQKPPIKNMISGTKTFDSLEIKGPIKPIEINFLNSSKDFLLLNEHQKIKDTKLTALVIDGNLKVENIHALNFNDMSLKLFFENAVWKNHHLHKNIENKVFHHLKTNDLSLTSEGKIDDVLLSQMMLRTVTLDGHQYVPGEKTFTESVKFSKPIIATTINDMSLDEYISNVVLINETKLITGKKVLTSSLSMQDMTVKNINDVNIIALDHKKLSKNKKNNVIVPMYFGNDVDIDHLHIPAPLLIDDVLVDSLVSVKNSILSYPIWVLATGMKVDGNVFVAGLTNGCDLNSMSKYTLQRDSNNEQVVIPESNLNSLIIKGNVHFKETFNKMSLNLIKQNLVGDDRYHYLVGDFHISPGVSANHIEVLGTLNGINLPFIIQDAVLNSVPQSVYGLKKFQEDLEIDILTGDNIYLQKSLNNINLQSLLDQSVLKKGFQVLDGDKIFEKFTAKNVTIYGSLNGIRFPQDVIMTAVSEYISSSVFIMKDVYMKMNFLVDGEINGVQLDQMAEDVVLLDKNEIVSSSLTFTHDISVKGNMIVDGLINDILLDLVVHINGSQVDNFKSFFDDLIILGNLNVNSINDYNVLSLFNSIAKYNKNENLNAVQVFTQPIYMKSTLISENFGGSSMQFITNSFLEKSQGMSVSINFLSNFSSSNNKLLDYELELLPYQVTSFAYFVIFQELPLKFSSKMLHGFQYQLNEMSWKNFIIWTAEENCFQNELCCFTEYSHWLKVNDDSLMKIETEPARGRYFPLPSVFRNKHLVVWTNTTSPSLIGCHRFNFESTAIGAFDETGLFQSFFNVRYSPSLVDVKVFKDGFTYIVAGYNYDYRNEEQSATVVYKGHEVKDMWTEYQVLPVYGILSMDLTTFEQREVLLVLGTGMGTYPDSYSPIYKWNEKSRQFGLLQNIPSQYATSVLWINHDQKLLLAIAGVENFNNDQKCFEKITGGQINIYMYKKGHFVWIQSLNMPGVISMVSFEIKGETYLAVASEALQSIKIYQMQGYTGFTSIQTLESPGVRSLGYFWRAEDLYLSVSSHTKYFKILKAVIRGNTFKTFSSTSELNDEPVAQKRSC